MTRPTKKRKQPQGLLIVPLIIFAFIAALFFGVDQMCVNDANARMPYYPDTTRVEENHNGLRIRGVGNSLEVVETTDSLETVEAWYQEHLVTLLKNRKQRGVNNIQHWFEKSAGSEGTRIFYLSQCIM